VVLHMDIQEDRSGHAIREAVPALREEV
jgi:hypothetical protein